MNGGESSTTVGTASRARGPSNAAILAVARSIWQATVARLPRFSRPTTGVLVVLMIVAGVVLRIQNVGLPFDWGFDESQMVGAARQFLLGVPDTGECCHPPLSKLLISASILAIGDNPLAWRFASLCLGLQTIVVSFLLAKSLFDDSRAAWLAAAFVAADGFFIAFSRDAFTEEMMTCLVLWSILAAVTARGWASMLTCAVLVGLAGSIKWSGFQVALPVCFAILLLRRVRWYLLASFAVTPLVHIAIWMIGLKLIGHSYDLASVWEEINVRRSRHLAFVHHTNPLETPWYTWLAVYHPLVLKVVHEEGNVRLASSMSNLPLFFASDACLLGLPVFGALAAFKSSWRRRWRKWFDADDDKALAIILAGWVCMMLLWFSGRITSYWYHYLTPYSFAVLLVAGVVARLDRRHRTVVLAFVAMVFAFFVYFAPVWAEFPISQEWVNRRLVFPLWR